MGKVEAEKKAKMRMIGEVIPIVLYNLFYFWKNKVIERGTLAIIGSKEEREGVKCEYS